MDNDSNQTNESHASVLNCDGEIGVVIPKEVQKEQVIPEPDGEIDAVIPKDAQTEQVIPEPVGEILVDDVIPKDVQKEQVISEPEGVTGDSKEDTQTIDEDTDLQLSNSNNQNATSALEEEGPFCDSMKDILIELEREPPVHENQGNLAASSTNAQGQDIDPNTNESNNTNASSCEVLSPGFEDGSQVVDLSSDSQHNSMSNKKRLRSRSRRRSSSVRQKNSSAFTPRRKAGKASNSSNVTQGNRRRTISRGLRSPSRTNKRRRRRN